MMSLLWLPPQPLLIIGIGGQIYLFNVASRQPVQPQATTAYLRQGLTKWWRSFAATRQEILMYAAWQFGLLVKFVKLVKFIKSQICFMMSSSDCVCVCIQIGCLPQIVIIQNIMIIQSKVFNFEEDKVERER